MKKQIENQMSLFDIELPSFPLAGEDIPEAIPEQQPSPMPQKISGARVPDEEFTDVPIIGEKPTVQKILKLLEKGTYKVGRHQFLSDVFECGAIAISNKFDFANYDKREERYMQIINSYDKDMRMLITQVFAEIYMLLSQQIHPAVGFNDYLGDLYMRSETSNSKAGQFFTPYSVSKCCAQVSINSSIVNEAIEQDKILTLHEPTCGAGGMVIAAADVLYNDYHFNISRNLLVECGDIDARCVHMSYLQLGLAGIPAVIFHRDGLTLETWDRWETPAYIMQWMRFKDVFKGTPSNWRAKTERKKKQ